MNVFLFASDAFTIGKCNLSHSYLGASWLTWGGKWDGNSRQGAFLSGHLIVEAKELTSLDKLRSSGICTYMYPCSIIVLHCESIIWTFGVVIVCQVNVWLKWHVRLRSIKGRRCGIIIALCFCVIPNFHLFFSHRATSKHIGICLISGKLFIGKNIFVRKR